MTEQELRTRFPAAFNDARKPLKLGINEDLNLPWGDPVLAEWTRHATYLRNVLAPGAVRVDLQGHAVSEVGPLERRYAWDRLMFLRAELAGIAATVRAQGHRLPLDLESRKRMPKRPEE
jgi:sRNA-binding protein